MSNTDQSSTATVGCDCIALTNKALATDGRSAMVDTSLIWSESTNATNVRISIRCVKTDRRDRKRTPVLIAKFCPICGTRYPTTAIAAAEGEAGR